MSTRSRASHNPELALRINERMGDPQRSIDGTRHGWRGARICHFDNRRPASDKCPNENIFASYCQARIVDPLAPLGAIDRHQRRRPLAASSIEIPALSTRAREIALKSEMESTFRVADQMGR